MFTGGRARVHDSGVPPIVVYGFTISANATNWNLLASIGSTPVNPVEVNITINSGIVVRSTNTSLPGMDLSGLPSGSTINIFNNGYIQGRGGNGGPAGSGLASGTAGGAGGDAIKGPGTGVTLNITNAAGNIWAGGGGGGGGGGSRDTDNIGGEVFFGNAGGGGGGGGAGGGSAGAGAASDTDIGGITNGQNGTAGGNAPSGTNGTGGSGGSVNATTVGCDGGDGGDGGGFGVAGTAGLQGQHGDNNAAGGAGGAAGKAINKLGGTVNFVSGNTAARVKGAVA